MCGHNSLIQRAGTASKALPGRQPQPATLVIFGARGDLTKRLLVPALYHLVQAGKTSVLALFAGGSVRFPRRAGWLEEFTAELLAFPGRQDD